MNLRKII